MNLLPAVSVDYLSTYQVWFVLVTFGWGLMVESVNGATSNEWRCWA